MSSGSTRTPASGGTNSGGPPTRVATTERPWPSPRGAPGRTARSSRAGRGRRPQRCSPGPGRAGRVPRPRRSAAPRAARAAGRRPRRRGGPAPGVAKASASRTTFFRSVRLPTQTKTGPFARPEQGLTRKELEVDAAVDDLGLAAGLGDLRLELAAEVVGDGDQRRGAADDESRCGRDSRVGADVADVAPVSGDDERRPRGDAAESPVGTRKCA